MDKERFLGFNTSKHIGREAIFCGKVDSTNNYAKILARNGAVHGTVVITDEQEKGKGRLGRTWKSRKGESIAMSLILRPDIPAEKASMLTIVAALAVAKAIEQCVGEGVSEDHERCPKTEVCAEPDSFVKIKWPNDIVINSRKVVGILTELSCELPDSVSEKQKEPDRNKSNNGRSAAVIDNVIVGIGINTEMVSFPEDIADMAGSILTQTGVRVDPDLLAAAVMLFFEKYYESFILNKDLAFLKDDYNEMLASREKMVKLIRDGREIQALCHGIDDTGRLLVTMEDGSTGAVLSGEVSVRGLYGYT